MIGGYIARTAVRGFLLAAIAALGAACAVALGPVAPAAAAPTLVIESPPSGSATNVQTPTISGTTTGSGPVTVNIYRGASAEGTPEQSPSDPLALFLAVLGTCAVALAASAIPARRATKIDPLVALRYE